MELDTISTVNSFSGLNFTQSNGRFTKMKVCVDAVKRYQITNAEDDLLIINQCLQALSLTLDIGIFDPHNDVTGMFYNSIFELVPIIEPRSTTMWYCIDTLLTICRNKVARQALLNTYKFMPYLAQMMSDNLTADKKIRLLRLMQTLTCGVKIYYQLPNMAHLITMLCKWIEVQEPEIIILSLGVLVNLCYENMSSLFILQRNINLKKFIRVCMSLKGPIVEVYVCFMSIILENVCGYVPGVVIPTLIDNTFKAVIDGCKRQDGMVLKQVVEFFIQWVRTNNISLCGYDKYREHMEIILELIEKNKDTGSPECLSVILDFINFFVDADLPQISCHFPRIIPVALNWTQESTVSYQALALLKSIAVNGSKKDANILEPLIANCRIFVLMLKSTEEEIATNQTDHLKRLGMLLQLFTAMVQVASMRQRISQELQQDVVKHIFQPLLGDESRHSENLCSIEAVNLYVYALALVSKLMECDKLWAGLFTRLLQQREIHGVIAHALQNSSKDVKRLALELSASCSEQVASSLGDLQSVLAENDRSGSVNCSAQTPDATFTVLPLAQNERLESILDSIETLISKNEVNSVATSELMELYNYKVANMAQSERAALVSLEASNRLNSHLQHQVTRLLFEQNKLQHSRVYTTKKLEETTKKIQELSEQKKDLQERFETNERDLKECKTALADTEEKLGKLQQWFNKIQENCRRLEKNEVKKDESLRQCNESIKTLKMEVKELEKSLKDKERILDETRKCLKEKSAILESITKMAASQSVLS